MSSADDNERKKFHAFLKTLARSSHKDFNPKKLAPALRLHDVLTEDEYDIVMGKPSSDERKVCLYIEVLPSKIASRTVPILGIISHEHNLPKLQACIRDSFGELYLQEDFVSSISAHPSSSIQYLKDFYIRDCEIMKRHWHQMIGDYSEEFEMDGMYIDLEIIKEGRRSKQKITGYRELFGIGRNRSRRQYRNIVLEGDPGMGKTTYLHRLVQSWAGNEDPWLHDQFSLVIMVRLGDLEADDTVLSYFRKRIPTEILIGLRNFILCPNNHQKILFVLDGYDEMNQRCHSVNRLIHEQFFAPDMDKEVGCPVTNATFLISTRILNSSDEHEELGRRLKKPPRDFLLRTFGFHPDAVKKNFAHKIKNLDSIREENELLNPFVVYSNSYRNPLLVGMAACLGYIPEELFTLMRDFCFKIVKRAKVNRKDKFPRESLKSLQGKVFLFLGKIAFSKILDELSNRYWTYNPLLKDLQPAIEATANTDADFSYETGLLWLKKREVTSIDEDSENRDALAYFPHRLFMEFFAAMFASECDVALNNLAEHFERLEAFGEMSKVFSYFLTGFSEKWKILIAENCIQDKNLRGRMTLVCPWLFQAYEVPHQLSLFNKTFEAIDGQTDAPNFGIFLTAYLPRIETLSKLNRIRLVNIDINPLSVAFLKALPKLQSLSFCNCSLCETIAHLFEKWLVQQDELESLSLEPSSDCMENTVIQAMQHHKKLKSLRFKDFRSENSKRPEIWKRLSISFSQRKLNGENSLEIFRLSNCGVCECVELAYKELPASLTELCIDDTGFSAKALNSLIEFVQKSSLKKVDVRRSSSIGESSKFIRAIPATGIFHKLRKR